MVRTGEPEKIIDATLHARKYLTVDNQTAMCIESAGLLAFDPDTDTEPFSVYLGLCSWTR